MDAIGDARSGSRVVLREVAAVELAAGDDAVRVPQLFRQVHGSQIQVGAGVQPDREGDRPVDQPVEQIRAGGGVVAPVREDVIVPGAVARGPGPRFRQDVQALRERGRAVRQRRCPHRRGRLHHRAELARPPRARAGETLQEAEVVHAGPRHDVLARSAEAVAPELPVERIDREDVQLDTGGGERLHVALEERRDARRILAGEDGQPHRAATPVLTTRGCAGAATARATAP